jgi:hypothetical protein
MAKQDDSDNPLFLDDVIVSLDRNHRGMVAELLQREFDQRQVILLTHDREWYADLRHQLDGHGWDFKVLLPYGTPENGICFSGSGSEFDIARAQVEGRPDAAGNDARKIMDAECARIAERLRIKLPYARGDKNDMRMAHDFLVRLIADGHRCFQMREATGSYRLHQDALDAMRTADGLLVSWGNRASHTFDLVGAEAKKLIHACEVALRGFECSACDKKVWFSHAEGAEWFQCQCGTLRWRYNKA